MKSSTWLPVALLSASMLGSALSPGFQRSNPPRGNPTPPPRPQAPPPRQATPPQPFAPPAHAQREPVRTPNYVPRQTPPTRPPSPPVNNQRPPVTAPPRTPPPVNNQRPPATGPTNPRPPDNNQRPNRGTVRTPVVPNAPATQSQRKFTKTAAGRVYDNGLTLRKGATASSPWQKKYFPKGHFHFPFYRTSFVRGQTYVSPFGFFFGVCVPFITASECHVFPPSVVFIDIPVYNGLQCTGYTDDGGANLINDPDLNQEQPGLLNAIDYLTEAFQGGNIDGLVSLIDPNTMVAVY